VKTEWIGGIGHCLLLEDEADITTLRTGIHIPKHPYWKGVYRINGDRYIWLMDMREFCEMREELLFAPTRDLAMTPEQCVFAEERYIRGRTGVQRGRIEVVVSNFAVRTFEEAEAVRKAIREANRMPKFLLDKTTGKLTALREESE
jgi:hypothetical protein